VARGTATAHLRGRLRREWRGVARGTATARGGEGFGGSGMARGTATAHRGKGRAEGRAFLPSQDRSRRLEGRNAAWSGTTSLPPPSPRSNGKKCRLERHNFPSAAVTPVQWEEMPPGGAQRPSSRAGPRPSRKQRRPPGILLQCAVAVPAPPRRAPRRLATSTALSTSRPSRPPHGPSRSSRRSSRRSWSAWRTWASSPPRRPVSPNRPGQHRARPDRQAPTVDLLARRPTNRRFRHAALPAPPDRRSPRAAPRSTSRTPGSAIGW
jgi:hypothetical protein